MNKYRILFVCLGNICRSPLAEGVFRHLAAEKGQAGNFEIDSCGLTNWNIGSSPHPESIRIARLHGISLAGQQARQIKAGDFHKFDLILAMDTDNLRELSLMSKSTPADIRCLREYDPKRTSLDISDPIGGGPEAYEKVFRIIHRCCQQLLEKLNL